MALAAPHDVIVVGAGPAGLYSALRTAEAGLDILVLEEHTEIGAPTHCTGIVSGETNQLYKIPGEVVLNRPSSCLVVSPGGNVAELEDPGEEIAVLDRAAFDRALATSVVEAGGGVPPGGRGGAGGARGGCVGGTTRRRHRLRARGLVLPPGGT